MTNFCTPEVKKFMMDKADSFWGRFFVRMKKAWKNAVAAALLGSAACVPSAYADGVLPLKIMKYESYQDPMFDPAYSIAWDAMAGLYKDTEFEKGRTNTINPFLDIAQFDLNGDNQFEIIAAPVPTDPEDKPLCTEVQICPFYILEVRDKTVRNLGIIPAATIDRGDDVKNGYWTLKVFQRNASGKFIAPETYAYDRAKDEYVLQPAPPAPSNKP